MVPLPLSSPNQTYGEGFVTLSSALTHLLRIFILPAITHLHSHIYENTLVILQR